MSPVYTGPPLEVDSNTQTRDHVVQVDCVLSRFAIWIDCVYTELNPEKVVPCKWGYSVLTTTKRCLDSLM